MNHEQLDDRVFRFRITLSDVEPATWRVIEAPGWYDFRDLHVAIQSAMGWTDSHLHMFTPVGEGWSCKQPIGIPGDDYDEEFIAGWETGMSEYFREVGDALDYTYDFGDGWEHRIELIDILPRESDAACPRCLEGGGACPPEDCGGPHGFERLREILADPLHEEYDEWMEWVGGEEVALTLLNPESFDPAAVVFEDPDDRWDAAIGG